MTSSNNSNKKTWKDFLLRSSLPLEHLIAQKLSKLGIYVAGEYTYLRPNENGIGTEFSTDLWAFNFLEENPEHEYFLSNCHFIIECKYTHQSISWIFSPHPLNNDESLEVGYINIFQDLCVKKVDNNLLLNFDDNLKYCIKGVEIHDKDCNPYTINKGLNQLKHASIQLSKKCMVEQICQHTDEDLWINFLCPILVTTAPLYVIKENLELDNFYDAQEIGNIADKVNFLIVHQDNGVQQEKYAEDIALEFCSRYKNADMRLREINKILKQSGYKGYHMPDTLFLADKLGRASERILVVNYGHFEECINNILNVIKSTVPTLTRYATLEYDSPSGRSTILPM